MEKYKLTLDIHSDFEIETNITQQNLYSAMSYFHFF